MSAAHRALVWVHVCCRVATAGWGALADAAIYVGCELSGVNSNGSPDGVDMSQLNYLF